MKEGYKQTEIGVIPEDWEVALFGEKSKIYRGGSPRPIQDYLTEADNGVNWIKIGDVSPDGKYITKTEDRIRPEGISKSREVHSGDFILSNSMSFGRPYILSIDGCIHDGWLAIQDYRETFSTEFLYYLLSSESVYKQQVAMAAGSSVKNLNKEKVSALLVCFPREKAEQHRIAEALSDMDELIASLEKLIAKKKAIKQGAMQELLTGKRRLPGFSGEWKTYKLGEVLSVKHGKAQQEIETPVGKYPILATSGTIGRTNIYLCNAPSVLIGRKGTIDKPQYMDTPFWTIDTLFYTLINAGFHAKYLYYLFCTIPWNDYNEASGVPSLSASVIESIPVKIPCYNEQLLLSDYLTDLDGQEIRLEKKAKKARQIKQGMMQQLLTGTIRLN